MCILNAICCPQIGAGGRRPVTGQLKERPRPAFGKKQFDNMKNSVVSGQRNAISGSSGANYSQAYGTITASGLAALHNKKW